MKLKKKTRTSAKEEIPTLGSTIKAKLQRRDPRSYVYAHVHSGITQYLRGGDNPSVGVHKVYAVG